MPNEPIEGVWPTNKPYATIEDLTEEEIARLNLTDEEREAFGIKDVVVVTQTVETEYTFEMDVPEGEPTFAPLDRALEDVKVIRRRDEDELEEIVVGVREPDEARRWEVDIIEGSLADAREGERLILSALRKLSVMHDSKNQPAAYHARLLVEEIESLKAVRDRRWEKEA